MASEDCMLANMRMSRFVHFLRLGAFIAVSFVGFIACESESNRRCDPLQNSGCSDGQTCTVDVDGELVCAALAAESAREGERCRAVGSDEPMGGQPQSTCGRGLACAVEHGVSRCLRFCDPEISVSQDTCPVDLAPVEGGQTLDLSAYSSCRIVLDGRPEVGLCGLPCRLGQSGMENGCPEGSGCALPLGAIEARCMPRGTQMEGQTCGVACPCADTLVCVPDERGAACRKVFDPEVKCADAIGLYRIPGTVDPLPLMGTQDTDGSGEPYAVCLPCRNIGVAGLSVCVSQDACVADQGQPADLNQGDLSAQLSAARLVLAMSVSPRVGAAMGEDGVWRWVATQEPIDETLWSDGAAPEAAECVTLTESGLQTTVECPSWTLCRPSERAVCATDG